MIYILPLLLNNLISFANVSDKNCETFIKICKLLFVNQAKSFRAQQKTINHACKLPFNKNFEKIDRLINNYS